MVFNCFKMKSGLSFELYLNDMDVKNKQINKKNDACVKKIVVERKLWSRRESNADLKFRRLS